MKSPHDHPDDWFDDYESADCLEDQLDVLFDQADREQSDCLHCGQCDDCIERSKETHLEAMLQERQKLDATIADLKRELGYQK